MKYNITTKNITKSLDKGFIIDMIKSLKSKSYSFHILCSLTVLAVPTVIEEIMSTLLQYVDTAMVGNLGENATASVSVTTTINWLVGSVPSAIGIAAIALISRAVGKKDCEESKKASSQIFILSVISGALLTVLCLILSPFIPVWMGAEKEIQKTASLYFAIISVPMIFRVINIVMGACLRATKNTKTPMIITLFENILNIVLNYILIYKVGLGVIGAAIGSAVSFAVSGAAMYFAYRKNDFLRYHLGSLSFDSKVLSECMKTAFPVLLTHCASCMGYVVFAGLVSSMGTTVFAAHSIAVSAEQIFYIAGYGFRSATSTMIGMSIGEKNQRKFKAVQKTSILITVLMMFISGTALYYTSFAIMDLLTSSDAVAVLGSQMLKLVAFSEPFFGLMIVLEGIYYGLSKTKYVFIAETASMWLIRIVFTFLCVKIFRLGLYEVWLCMIADNIFKAVLLAIPFVFKKVNYPTKGEINNDN